jgi:pantetheine-phosphate adenylyltransferase
VSVVGVYTGSFDPMTLGHLDIIRRSMAFLDRLVIGVGANSAKAPLFTLAERVATVQRETAGIEGVEVRPFDGLAVDFARSEGAGVIVRGLRTGSDLDFESGMAAMNRMMAGEIETIFLVASPELQPIASSLVRDVARAGGDVTRFVTQAVAAELRAKAR